MKHHNDNNYKEDNQSENLSNTNSPRRPFVKAPQIIVTSTNQLGESPITSLQSENHLTDDRHQTDPVLLQDEGKQSNDEEKGKKQEE